MRYLPLALTLCLFGLFGCISEPSGAGADSGRDAGPSGQDAGNDTNPPPEDLGVRLDMSVQPDLQTADVTLDAMSADAAFDAADSGECGVDTDCQRGFICQTMACVEGCRRDVDCARSEVCHDNICSECGANSDCAQPESVCDLPAGVCVECTEDSDCGAGEQCDPATDSCLAALDRAQCEPCSDTTNCGVGMECITVLGIAGETEQVCLRGCSADSDPCAPGYACGNASNPTVTNQCWPSYGALAGAARSCWGLRSQGQPCQDEAECGLPNIGDAICDPKAGICRVTCLPTSQTCIAGLLCQCPADHTFDGMNCAPVAGAATPPICL